MARASRSARRSLVGYAVLTYALSWPCWVAWQRVGPETLLGTGLYALGGFGPFVAALAMTWRERRPVREWLAGIFRVRLAPRYYAIAFCLPVLIVVVAAAGHVWLFAGTVSLEGLPSPQEYPLYLVVVLVAAGGQEEPGWRGYLLPRLQRQYSALAAALLVAVVWAGWHAPLFLLPETLHGDLSPTLYVAQLLALSIVLTWLTNATVGAVWPAMIAHAGANAMLNYYPVGGATGATTWPGLGLLVGVLSLLALGIVLRYGSTALAPTSRWTDRAG